MKAPDSWWNSKLEIEAELLHGLHSQKMLDTDIEYIPADSICSECGNASECALGRKECIDNPPCKLRTDKANELILELVDMIKNVTLKGGQISEALQLIAKAKEFVG